MSSGAGWTVTKAMTFNTLVPSSEYAGEMIPLEPRITTEVEVFDSRELAWEFILRDIDEHKEKMLDYIEERSHTSESEEWGLAELTADWELGGNEFNIQYVWEIKSPSGEALPLEEEITCPKCSSIMHPDEFNMGDEIIPTWRCDYCGNVEPRAKSEETWPLQEPMGNRAYEERYVPPTKECSRCGYVTSQEIANCPDCDYSSWQIIKEGTTTNYEEGEWEDYLRQKADFKKLLTESLDDVERLDFALTFNPDAKYGNKNVEELTPEELKEYVVMLVDYDFGKVIEAFSKALPHRIRPIGETPNAEEVDTKMIEKTMEDYQELISFAKTHGYEDIVPQCEERIQQLQMTLDRLDKASIKSEDKEDIEQEIKDYEELLKFAKDYGYSVLEQEYKQKIQELQAKLAKSEEDRPCSRCGKELLGIGRYRYCGGCNELEDSCRCSPPPDLRSEENGIPSDVRSSIGKVRCPDCNGEGTYEYDGETRNCSICGGSGELSRSEYRWLQKQRSGGSPAERLPSLEEDGPGRKRNYIVKIDMAEHELAEGKVPPICDACNDPVVPDERGIYHMNGLVVDGGFWGILCDKDVQQYHSKLPVYNESEAQEAAYTMKQSLGTEMSVTSWEELPSSGLNDTQKEILTYFLDTPEGIKLVEDRAFDDSESHSLIISISDIPEDVIVSVKKANNYPNIENDIEDFTHDFVVGWIDATDARRDDIGEWERTRLEEDRGNYKPKGNEGEKAITCPHCGRTNYMTPADYDTPYQVKCFNCNFPLEMW